MAVSDNGYLVDPSPAALGVVSFAVNGVSFGGGVKSGDVHTVLHYVASQVAERVEAPDTSLGCYGYAYRANVNNPGVWSNHASGTAIDFNASLHGNGSAATSSWTSAQITEIHKILAEVNNVVRWGGDYNSTPDSMHFEINVVPAVLAIEAASLPATGGTGGGGGTSLTSFVWAPNEYLLQTVNIATGAIQTITSGDAAIVAAVGTDPAFGSIRARGDRVQVNYDARTGTQDSMFLTGFSTAGLTLRKLPENTYWSGRGYVDYAEADGVYDPVTAKIWEASCLAGQSPWEWWAYDDSGGFLEGRGNTSLIIGDGDNYLGSTFGYNIGASMLGRWLYREMPAGDGIIRYNLDTDVWEAVYHQRQPVTTDGAMDIFQAADTTSGKYLTTNVATRSGAAGRLRWLRVRDPADGPWANPVPNSLFPGVDHRLGPPEAEYDPTPPGYETFYLSTWNNGSGGVRCLNGWAYYTCGKPAPYNYGDICMAFCRMNILTGVVEIVCEIPYHDYLADATVVTGPENWDDTWGDNGPRAVRFDFVAAEVSVVAEFAITVDESGWIFSFDASFSSADPGSIVSWTWDFADPVVYDPVQPVEGEFVNHIFEAVPATYVVTLTVTSDGGQTASVSHPVIAGGGLISENPLDDYRYFSG